MKRLLGIWRNIQYSLWFIPALIVSFSVLLAVLSIVLDGRVDSGDLPDWPRLFTGSADGARGTLEVIAAAMISIGALTFSITVLVLSSAASTYTPRVIRTFMGSTLTKTVLGVFVGVYVYALIVLRTVSSSEPEFVPAIGVTLGLILALVGVGFLIAFIHHMAYSIEVSSIVSTLGRDTVEAARKLFPQEAREAGAEPERASADDSSDTQLAWFPVPANATGYIQAIDSPSLARTAGENGVQLKMERAVGEFVIEGEPVMHATQRPDDALMAAVNRCFSIGAQRTVEQDVSVGIRQLADIALRAISASVNDSTTAAMCVDYLTGILAELGRRRLSSETETWEGRRTLRLRCPDFADYLRLAFEQIRQQAGANLAIYLRMLDALETIARAGMHPSRRKAVEREASLVVAYGRAALRHADEQARLEQAWRRTCAAISMTGDGR
ncbi:MAG TPA: DUF2254 domain-containing protein [Noviherbaspirillum sp.]|nr:DUF2254 domain-containing protein [Noviherbaspirillum sp.]